MLPVLPAVGLNRELEWQALTGLEQPVVEAVQILRVRLVEPEELLLLVVVVEEQVRRPVVLAVPEPAERCGSLAGKEEKET